MATAMAMAITMSPFLFLFLGHWFGRDVVDHLAVTNTVTVPMAVTVTMTGVSV